MIEDLVLFRPTFLSDYLPSMIPFVFPKEMGNYDIPEGFIHEDGGYVLEVEVNDVNVSLLNVEVENEKFVKISYSDEKENGSSMFEVKELLPLDCDSSTLTATMENNKLYIRVKQHG